MGVKLHNFAISLERAKCGGLLPADRHVIYITLYYIPKVELKLVSDRNLPGCPSESHIIHRQLHRGIYISGTDCALKSTTILKCYDMKDTIRTS